MITRRMRIRKISLSFHLLCYFPYLLFICVQATNEQCQLDCQQIPQKSSYQSGSPSFNTKRLVGPTRPWHQYDQLGNKLLLTRPYPYSLAGNYVTVMNVNITVRIGYSHQSFINNNYASGDNINYYQDSDNDLTSETTLTFDESENFTSTIADMAIYYLNVFEKKIAEEVLQSYISISNITLYHISFLNYYHHAKENQMNTTIDENELYEDVDDTFVTVNGSDVFDVRFQTKFILEHNGYDDTQDDSFYKLLQQRLLNPLLIMKQIDTKDIYSTIIQRYHDYIPYYYPNVTMRKFLHTDEIDYNTYKLLHTRDTQIQTNTSATYNNYNPYSKFCEYGCSLFYSSTSSPLQLSECTDKCDETYRYNISVGYNDLAEVARLECQDGCQIALRRCQPGYYCSQVYQVINDEYFDDALDNQTVRYKGGSMEHCPPGTYRDVSYEAVEACIPCPSGTYREDTKGKNVNTCSKCPAGTYSGLVGSSSILNCLRCPAGTFTNVAGSAYCLCITPQACSKNQLPSPADAEKRDTIPYIGRW